MMLVSQQLGQSVVDYLKRQPYEDVYQMIAALVQCKQVPNGRTDPTFDPE